MLSLKFGGCIYLLQIIILSHHNSPSCSQNHCVVGQLEMPVESTTGTCFLELYIQNILALQEASAGQSISDFSSILILSSPWIHPNKLEAASCESFEPFV